MRGKIIGAGGLLCWFPACFAVADIDTSKQAVRTVSFADALHWTIGLLIVLGIFFLCVWGMRRLSGIGAGSTEKMRIVGGLSLGMRERVVLVQVGKKQLVLGVTPGRIDTLHVLEGEDCLSREEPPASRMETKFAQELMRVMKRRSDV